MLVAEHYCFQLYHFFSTMYHFISSLKDIIIDEGVRYTDLHQCRTCRTAEITLSKNQLTNIKFLSFVSYSEIKLPTPTPRSKIRGIFIDTTSITHTVESSRPAPSKKSQLTSVLCFLHPQKPTDIPVDLPAVLMWPPQPSKNTNDVFLARHVGREGQRKREIRKIPLRRHATDYWTARYSGVQKSTGNGEDRGVRKGVPAWKSWTSIYFGSYVQNASRICM